MIKAGAGALSPYVNEIFGDGAGSLAIEVFEAMILTAGHPLRRRRETE